MTLASYFIFLGLRFLTSFCLVAQMTLEASLILAFYYSLTNKILCLDSGPVYLKQEIRPFAAAVAMLR